MSELDNLVTAYLRQFPDEAERLALLRAQLRDGDALLDRKNFRGHATASGLVLDKANVLLILHRGLGRYLQPGGHHAEGEAPDRCAQREVTEETGVTVELHPWHTAHGAIPIHIDSHPIPRNERKGEDAHYHHDFVYLFSPHAGSKLTPQASEVDDCRWVPLTTPFEDHCLAEVARKLAALGLAGAG
jgi:8-oxo-dGTP pyrophosphatase MutT (NUDIX family)